MSACPSVSPFRIQRPRRSISSILDNLSESLSFEGTPLDGRLLLLSIGLPTQLCTDSLGRRMAIILQVDGGVVE